MRSPNAAARHNAHTASRHTTIATTARRARGMQQHRQQVRAGDPHTQRRDGFSWLPPHAGRKRW